jgi:hypothetical protein
MPNVSDVFREAMKMLPMTEEELDEYNEERKAARRQVAETARAAKDLEDRKARKAARAQAHLEQQVARRAQTAKDSILVTAKRKRGGDENDPIADDGLRRVKRVRICAVDELTPPPTLPTVIDLTQDLPFETEEQPGIHYYAVFQNFRIFLIFFLRFLLFFSAEHLN